MYDLDMNEYEFSDLKHRCVYMRKIKTTNEYDIYEVELEKYDDVINLKIRVNKIAKPIRRKNNLFSKKNNKSSKRKRLFR